MVFFSGNNHFTIFVEVVSACWEQTVCIFFRNCLISALFQLAAVAYIIVGILNFDKTCAHRDISIFIYVIYSVGSGKQPLLSYLAYKRAVNTEIKSIFLERRAVAKDLYAVCEITVVSEIICLAVNFMKRHISRVTRHIIARTVIIACAIIVLVPSALCHTGLIKLIRHAIDCIFTGYSSLSMRAEVVPVFTDLHPAAGQRTYLGITPFAVDLNKSGILTLIFTILAEVIINAVDCIDTGNLLAIDIIVVAIPAIDSRYAIDIRFAVCPYAIVEIAASGALQHTVNNFIAMSCCGNSCAPINNGVADFAKRSSCVARFCACCCFVGKCIRGVDMSAVPSSVVRFAFGGGDHILRHLVHLGVDLRTFTGECILVAVGKRYETTVDFHADINRPEFLHALELRIGICLLPSLCTACIGITHFEFPGADRQRSKNAFTGLCIRTGAFKCDGCNIFVVLDRVISLKACGNVHVLQFPLAHVVQVDINRHRLNLFDIGSNDIRIPYRTKEDLVKRRIFCYDLNGRFVRISLNIDLANNRSVVALLIANREFDMVNAICKRNTGDRHHAVLEGASSFNTVDIGFCRRSIQTGVVVLFHIIGNFNAEGKNVFGNSLAIQNRCIRHTVRCIGHIAEYRCFTVLNCIGIVHRDIVNIHDVSTVVGLVLVVIVVVGRTVTVGNVELENITVKQIQSLIFA